MALIKCPECGHDVSSEANACSNCAYPIKKNLGNQQNNETNEKVSPIDKFIENKNNSNSTSKTTMNTNSSTNNDFADVVRDGYVYHRRTCSKCYTFIKPLETNCPKCGSYRPYYKTIINSKTSNTNYQRTNYHSHYWDFKKGFLFGLVLQLIGVGICRLTDRGDDAVHGSYLGLICGIVIDIILASITLFLI